VDSIYDFWRQKHPRRPVILPFVAAFRSRDHTAFTIFRYGGDVVKVAPPFDPSGNTAFVGASLMFDIMCLVADSASTRVNGKK
jgi:hypothetical protein